MSAAAGALYVHFPSKGTSLAKLARLGHGCITPPFAAQLLQAGDDRRVASRTLVRATPRCTSYPQLAVVVNEGCTPARSARGASSGSAPAVGGTALGCPAARVTAGRFAIGNLRITAAAIGAIGLRIPYWYAPGATSPSDLAQQHADLALRMVGFSPSKEIVDVCRNKEIRPPSTTKRLARIAPHLLAALAAMLLACGPADGAADSATERAEATLTSRCQATSSQVICSQRGYRWLTLFVPRR